MLVTEVHEPTGTKNLVNESYGTAPPSPLAIDLANHRVWRPLDVSVVDALQIVARAEGE